MNVPECQKINILCLFDLWAQDMVFCDRVPARNIDLDQFIGLGVGTNTE